MVTHLSYSSLTTWERCPKSFELSRIRNGWAIPGWYFLGGSAVHKACEDMDLKRPVLTWEEYFYPLVEEAMQKEPDLAGWLAGGARDAPDAGVSWNEIGPRCIANWQDFTAGDFTPSEVELDVTCRPIGLYFPIKGFIDRIGHHQKHGDLIVDLKTGKNAPKDKGLQLGVYAALYEARYGIRINRGAYFMAREGRLTRPVDLSQYTIEWLVKRFRDTAREISAGVYPARQDFTCRFCDQRLNCYAESGDTPRTRYWDSDNPHFVEEIPF